ncbi:MAG: Asp-tRNA(Asn)/Glu-tRNA(Gln) amidotransferase subunit GatC [Candidatus Odinarchaeia archaeon]
MSELISRDEVKHIAWLSKISLTDEQLELFTEQFNEILKYFRKLDEVDTSNIKLELYVTPLKDTYRSDEVKPSLKLSDALKNAPDKEKNFIKAPKIV